MERVFCPPRLKPRTCVCVLSVLVGGAPQRQHALGMLMLSPVMVAVYPLSSAIPALYQIGTGERAQRGRAREPSQGSRYNKAKAPWRVQLPGAFHTSFCETRYATAVSMKPRCRSNRRSNREGLS